MIHSAVISSAARSAPWSSGLLLILMVALTEAKALPALSCDVSAQADGTFLHVLSASFGPECSPGWEDISHIAITQGSDVDRVLVQDLTERSLTLRRCLDFSRFTATCPEGVWTEAVCRFDCSSVRTAVDSVAAALEEEERGREPQEEDGGPEPQEEDGGPEPQEEDGGPEPQEEDGGREPQEEDGGPEPQEEDGGPEPQEEDGGPEPAQTPVPAV